MRTSVVALQLWQSTPRSISVRLPSKVNFFSLSTVRRHDSDDALILPRVFCCDAGLRFAGPRGHPAAHDQPFFPHTGRTGIGDGRPPTEEESCLSRLAMWLRFNLDYFTAFVLAINLIFMCVELELQGRAAGHLAGESSSFTSLQDLKLPLRSLDIAFDTVFLIELLLRDGTSRMGTFPYFLGLV